MMFSPSHLRRLLIGYVLLLVPITWLATKFDRYGIDGDAMNYMDIADLIRGHQWAGVVNGYWHPLYPAGIAVAQTLLHSTRWNELHAAYVLNYAIFLASVAAMLGFVAALDALRRRMWPSDDQSAGGSGLLSLNALRLLGLGLLVIASQRELAMGRVRPDALLQALMLAAFAMLLRALATESLVYAPLMGLFLGLAYLTKSFAFLIALLAIAVMMIFQAWLQRRRLGRVALGGALALVVFVAFAGPYVAALSKQKHRFDFGDSGALNYAWYVSGTEKFHIEPWMTDKFGSASVTLVHPEAQLLAQPGIYSYRAQPYGTYPDWFDPTYFHERIIPKFNAKLLLHRDVRNVVLSLRYLLNHPEGPVLLILMLVICGARVSVRGWKQDGFWLPAVALGAAMWAIYGLVNIEERYVTLAYLLIVLPVFAALKTPVDHDEGKGFEWLPAVASAMVAVLAFLALGESLRVALDARRNESAEGLPAAWYSPSMFGAAKALNALGVGNGDDVACMGTIACLNDPYWMRVADVHVRTEVYNPDPTHLLEEFDGLPNREDVYRVLKSQGAKVLVASFEPGAMTGRTAGSSGWIRLGETNLYALPLNIPAPAPAPPVTLPWDRTGQEKP
jgi:4-amino-4-deoxy-L-arabinose transferase-like glycosyltransferase